MEIHPAADIFPLDEAHIDSLAADIREHGLLVPIETLDGKIIDGRRRLRACEKVGVNPRYKAIQATDPVAYVLSLNLERRHLSVTQLAMVAARARQWYDQEAKERQKASGGDRKNTTAKSVPVNLPEPITAGDARDKAGGAVGISGKTVDMATHVLEHATPKLQAAVDADQLSVFYASRMACLPDDEQDAIADRAAEKAARGGRRRSRPAAALEAQNGQEASEKEKLKGIALANEACECLNRIPRNDSLRRRCFQIVTDWIRLHK